MNEQEQCPHGSIRCTPNTGSRAWLIETNGTPLGGTYCECLDCGLSWWGKSRPVRGNDGPSSA